ncbi:MAG: hypothetical protein FJ098_08375 [Deltaproteobacteria bacterium]|nr:hypothetical protein [Deltaproteobacteria bacterium]
MTPRPAAALSLAVAVLLPAALRAEQDMVFFNGYAEFDYRPSTPEVPAEGVPMEAHARAADVGSGGPGALVVRVEFPRPVVPLTAEGAWAVLVLELPPGALELSGGTLEAAGDEGRVFFYELPEAGGAPLFQGEPAGGSVRWAHPLTPVDGEALSLEGELRFLDPGTDGVEGTMDDRRRELGALRIRLFRTAEQVPLPSGPGAGDPGWDPAVPLEAVVFYDDGCAGDPTVSDGDGTDWESGEDAGCDGDTWEDDGWETDSDDGCGDDWADGDDGWEGDRWSLEAARGHRIRGMGFLAPLASVLRAGARPLRVGTPLLLALLLLLGLKHITPHRLTGPRATALTSSRPPLPQGGENPAR